MPSLGRVLLKRRAGFLLATPTGRGPLRRLTEGEIARFQVDCSAVRRWRRDAFASLHCLFQILALKLGLRSAFFCGPRLLLCPLSETEGLRFGDVCGEFPSAVVASMESSLLRAGLPSCSVMDGEFSSVAIVYHSGCAY